MNSHAASTQQQKGGVGPGQLALRGIVAVLCALVAVLPAEAAVYYGCIGIVKMYNEVRTVNGPVNAECSGDWPWPGTLPRPVNHRMLDSPALRKEWPCESPGSRKVRSSAS